MICRYCNHETGDAPICPYCGKRNLIEPQPHHLPIHTVIDGKYVIKGILGEGGFGITYLGYNNKLGLTVAVKEYFPHGFSYRDTGNGNEIYISSEDGRRVFEHGKERFLDEGRILARFDNEPGIVSVVDFAEENNTAYLVMEYLSGVTLLQHLKQYGIMSAEQAFTLLEPVMKTLEKIHNAGYIHRDISPDNIMMLNNGVLKLMDFGAAREYIDEQQSMSVLLKKRYAPEEQYRRNGKQGPWTDVYALCATIYRCITGSAPAEALDRNYADHLTRPSQLGADISPELEQLLLYGMEVHQEDRCQSMTELMALWQKTKRSSADPSPDADTPFSSDPDDTYARSNDIYAPSDDSAGDRNGTGSDLTEEAPQNRSFELQNDIEPDQGSDETEVRIDEESDQLKAFLDELDDDDSSESEQEQKQKNEHPNIIAVVIAIISVGVMIWILIFSGTNVFLTDPGKYISSQRETLAPTSSPASQAPTEEFKLNSYTTHDYDAKGRVIRDSKYDSNNKLGSSTTYKYGDDGELTEFTFLDENNNVRQLNVVEVNSHGDEVKQTHYNADNEMTGGVKMEREYDSNGNCTRSTTTGLSGGIIDDVTYEYDGDGKVIKRVDKNSYYLTERRMKYDEKGNLIKTEIYNEDGEKTGFEEYKYNSDNQLVKKFEYSINNFSSDKKTRLSDYYEYQYDSNGNLIKEIRYVSS